jgi:hypothetical protein
MAAALQQQQQLWGALEAPVRVHGWLLQQQQQQQQADRPVLNPNVLATLLPSLVAKQRLTSLPLSMMLSLCKLAQLYGKEHPPAGMALAYAVTSTAAAALTRYRGPKQQMALGSRPPPAAAAVCCPGCMLQQHEGCTHLLGG